MVLNFMADTSILWGAIDGYEEISTEVFDLLNLALLNVELNFISVLIIRLAVSKHTYLMVWNL